MSIDPTLRVQSGVSTKRNVLKRAERVALMTDNGDFDEENGSPLGLRKTRVKQARKAPKKAAAEQTEGAEEGAEASSDS